MNAAAGLVVMVVEDHDFQRRTVARMLRSMGAREVLEAGDGDQAMALIQGVAIDLMVCDLNMPNMDGMELIRHLGGMDSTVSFVISSAQELSILSSVETMAKEYGVRVLGAIEKPVTLDRLEEMMARHHAPRTKRTAGGAPGFSLAQILDGLKQKQFEPFFQPKVDLRTGRAVGAEALARWRHPEHGVVSPYGFIAMLEQSRNLEPLTYVMLEAAAMACRAWRARGWELSVSVNLSLTSLTDTSLAERITQIVRSRGLDPKHMILEITETAAMSEVAPALENLARLRMHGFGLSVDDYGTGFSSLKQLTRVAFTELKVDQGFVTGCGSVPASRSIVESCVEMARRLGIKSVAEGVETQSDWDVLKAAGCDVAQGYLIAKPMDGDSFVAFCAAEAAR